MESRSRQIARDHFPFFRVYKDGVVEKYSPIEKISPYDDPDIGVRSKDVIISTEPPISARIFIPRIRDQNMKLPLIIYLHGGGFCLGSAFDPRYHNFVASLVAAANAVAVSVEYRLAPEHPLSACYEDSWAALQWAASHANSNGPADQWLNKHVDFRRVFLAGDSSGGNIIHNLMVKAGPAGLAKMKVVGLCLIHPYFAGKQKARIWSYLCPNDDGMQDRRIRPPLEDLARICCEQVLVILAEKDHLTEGSKRYCENLKRSGCGGSLEILEQKGVGHVFHLLKPNCKQAVDLMRKIVSFINLDKVEWRSKI